MTRRFFLLFFLIACAFMYGAERIVTIESARTSEYIKTKPEVQSGQNGQTGTGIAADAGAAPQASEVLRFSGDVVIVVTEGESVSRIGADEIIYDKNRDTLEARGHVKYRHTTGGTSSEEFAGEALLFNIKIQEGVFLNGAVTQNSGTASIDPYIIRSEVTGRDSSSTMAFRNGVLTTCDAPEPHWTINATRIWLLPGNEIAILNGVFFVGSLPVFYIPFFYYPSDEMIIHPVFGFRNREGYFVQTTSYLVGRKPIEQKTASQAGPSFSNFLQGDTLKEQKHNGLFLQNLETPAKNLNSNYLKLMADAYSSLGSMIALDGSFTPNLFLTKLTFTGAIGFSKNLYPPATKESLVYSTYDSLGKETYNSGWFFGNEVPFRYRANLAFQIDKKPFQLSVAVPIVSDTVFKSDFLNRSEDLNWFKLLTSQDQLAKTTTPSEETTYTWNIRGSILPDVSFFNPWIKTASVTNLSGLLLFESQQNKSLSGEKLLYSPEKKFFYPSTIRPEIKLSFGGTLYSSEASPAAAKKETETETATVKPESAGILNPFTEETLTPEAAVSSGPAAAAAPQASADENTNRYMPSAGSGLVPELNPPVAAYSVTWNLDPSFLQEIKYDSTNWSSPGDIKWNKYSSIYYQLQNTAKLQGIYSWDTDLLSVASGITYTGIKQEHPFLSDTVPSLSTSALRDVIKLNDYKANIYTISTADSVKIVPFNRNPYFKPISLAWNMNADLIRTVFDGKVDNPDWKTETFDWDKKYIKVHTATTALGISLANYEQKITVESNLSPLLESYKGTSGFSWFFGSLVMDSRLYEKEKAYKKWFWDPFTLSLNWKLPLDVILSQQFVYDIEEDTPSRLNFTASRGYFSAFYTINNTIPYILDRDNGWVFDGTKKKFVPSAAGFTFNNGSKPLQLYQWKNRIFFQANLASNLSFNLLKLTDSNFDFIPTITLKIFEFMDISFSSNSRNDVIARYFQDWINLPAPLPGETNLGNDLIKSFNFFNRQDREQSGFKLKSLNIDITHYLHDWTMSLKTTLKPELKTTNNVTRYDFIPTITFMVQWKPISDIKVSVKSEKDVFSLNTGDTAPVTAAATP